MERISLAQWKWDDALRGVIPPLISPLRELGDADDEGVAALIERVWRAGCTGLFVLGGCGEGAWLTAAQRGTVIRVAVKAAAGRVPVLVGVMQPATGSAIEATRQAAGEGADAVVVGSPYYFPVDAAAQQRHIEAVMTATRLPGLLYDIPQCTHHTLAPETVARLAQDIRVLGIKDSAGDFPAFQRLLAIKRARPSFRVLQGVEELSSASLLQGADGLVPGLANVAPGLMVALRRAADSGNFVECAQFQERVTGLAELYAHGPWLPALKAACATLGIGDGRPAPPFIRATAENREAVEAILARYHAGDDDTISATDRSARS